MRKTILFLLSIIITSCAVEQDTVLKISCDHPSAIVNSDGTSAELNIGATGDNIIFKVESSSEWTVDENQSDWYNVEYNKNTLVINVEQFISDNGQRESMITLRNQEGLNAYIYIDQVSDKPTTLNIKMGTNTISSRGGTISVNVESNFPESISAEIIDSPVNFLTVQYDKTNKLLNIGADKNITGKNISAKILITAGYGSNIATEEIEIHQHSGKMVLKYRTDKDGIVIALPLWGLVDVNIDWGDNSNEDYKILIPDESENGYITHWYEKAGEYEVAISGNIERIYCNGSQMCINYLTDIIQWGDNNIKSLENAFSGTMIQNVPSPETFSLENVTNVKSAFENCSKLESVAYNIFDSSLEISNFSFLFKGCSSLKGESPYSLIDGKKIHLYERKDNDIFLSPSEYTETFRDCNNLEDYNDIPANWK